MRTYFCLIRRIGPGDYRVAFPDFPGKELPAEGFDAARELARRWLEKRLARMGERGERPPLPTPRRRLQEDPRHFDAVAFRIVLPEHGEA